MLPDLTRESLLSKAQLIRLLQIQSKLRCGIEKRRQTYRGIARDASLSFDHCRDPVRLNFEGPGEPIGIDRWLCRLHEFLEQDFCWMNRPDSALDHDIFFDRESNTVRDRLDTFVRTVSYRCPRGARRTVTSTSWPSTDR